MLGRPAITPCPHPRTTKNSLSRHINHFSPRIEAKPTEVANLAAYATKTGWAVSVLTLKDSTHHGIDDPRIDIASTPDDHGSCPGRGVNTEHGRRFRFTTCKSAKKESRPCLFEYQPSIASAPESMPYLPRIGSFRRSLKRLPGWALNC